jgi:hypothetical protein
MQYGLASCWIDSGIAVEELAVFSCYSTIALSIHKTEIPFHIAKNSQKDLALFD